MLVKKNSGSKKTFGPNKAFGPKKNHVLSLSCSQFVNTRNNK